MAQDTKFSSQTLDNRSFNETFQKYEQIAFGFDANANTIRALSVDENGDLKATIEPNKVMAGPLEDTGYLYIGYKKPDGTYFIKRQNLTTTLWTYTYFASAFSTNWTNKTSLTYGDPQ